MGEKPGEIEANFGKVFVGDTGKELNNLYLPLAGLERATVRICNTVRCRLGDSNSKPTPKQIDACARHWLPSEVSACAPIIIVLLGSTACSLIPSIELDKEHGIPRWVTPEDHQHYLGEYEGWVFPSYHPAAGLHMTSVMIQLIDDFTRFKSWSQGRWSPPNLQCKDLDYAYVESRDDIDRSFAHIAYDYLPIDTESDSDRPWSIQYSPAPGIARMIMADRPDLITHFSHWLAAFDGLMLHNAVYDLGILDKMKIPTSMPIRDTMQEAYQFGNLPQGLKALAFRLLGVRMRSYEDVVMPPSRARMIEWLSNQYLEALDHKIKVEVKLKTRVKYLYKASPAESVLKRLLRHAGKPDYDVWQKAREAGLTGYPLPSIAHVPAAEALHYGCQDSDLTGRLGTLFESERDRIVKHEWAIEDGDEDL